MTFLAACVPGASWEQRANRFYRAMPYFLLTVSSLLELSAVAGGYRTWSAYYVTLLISGVTVAWQVLWDLSGTDPVRRRGRAAVFFVVRFALIAVLVGLGPWYGVAAFLGYLDAARMFAWPWPIPAFVGTALVSAGSQMGGYPAATFSSVTTYALVGVFNMVLAGGIGYFSYLLERQSEERRSAVAELTEANARLETALSENAGLHAQLLAQAREAGVMDERARLAREIHDTLAQGLTGIVTQIQAAGQAADSGLGWRRHLDTAERLARDSLTEARRSVHAMRPEALENGRLPEALAAVARDWSATHGVRAEVTVTGTPRPLGADVELALFRTAQEALANVAKHACASRAGVTLSYMEDLVTLDVRDDGVGFHLETVRALGAVPPSGLEPVRGGFGLEAMRERIGRLRGTFEIESEPGHGTAVSASIPTLAVLALSAPAPAAPAPAAPTPGVPTPATPVSAVPGLAPAAPMPGVPTLAAPAAPAPAPAAPAPAVPAAESADV